MDQPPVGARGPQAPDDRGRSSFAAVRPRQGAVHNVPRRSGQAQARAFGEDAIDCIGAVQVSIVLMGVLATVDVVAQFVGPYLIDDFVEFLGRRCCFRMEGYVLVSCFIIADVVAKFSKRYYTLAMHQLNFCVRVCVTAIIYKKWIYSTEFKQVVCDNLEGKVNLITRHGMNVIKKQSHIWLLVLLVVAGCILFQVDEKLRWNAYMAFFCLHGTGLLSSTGIASSPRQGGGPDVESGGCEAKLLIN